MNLKEFFVKLGLNLDAQSFAKGQLDVDVLRKGLDVLRMAASNVFTGLVDAVIGGNAEAERMKMSLAGIAGMNLKLPWEEAKAAADELYAGLQADAARTLADTAELVVFSSQIANSYLKAGKGMSDLRSFTSQAVVAAKMLNLQGTAALDITQALSSNVGMKDRFAISMIETQGLTKEQFNAKSVKERVEILTKAFNSPTIKAAMKEYESNWAGVTSTLADNAGIIAREVGAPLFDLLKDGLKWFGGWIQKNKDSIVKFFKVLGGVFVALYNVSKAIVGVIAKLVGWYYKFGKVLGTVATAATGVAVAMAIAGDAAVIAGLKSARAWLMAVAPIIALVALLAIAFLLVEDVIVGMEGGKSVVFELYEAWSGFLDKWLGDIDGNPWWLVAIKELIFAVTHLPEVWEEFGKWLKGFMTSIGQWITDFFAGIWAGIKQAARDALDELNPFSGSSGNTFENKLLARTQAAMSGPSVNNAGARAITVAPHIQNLTVQTTGDPDHAANAMKTALEGLLTVKLREAAEGVR